MRFGVSIVQKGPANFVTRTKKSLYFRKAKGGPDCKVGSVETGLMGLIV
jgi:hypothetical protein